ncbi:MAG TPA: hypothetical protein VIR78_13210 [Malonomonas sp.]
MNSLAGKTALITGGSRSIGAAIARQFSDADVQLPSAAVSSSTRPGNCAT